MSEFSESVHLLGSVMDAGDLIRKAEIRSVLAPAKRRWASFVLETGKPSSVMLEANPSWLLHYEYAEDHGWGFSLYQRNRLVARYERAWDPSPAPGKLTCPTPVEELAALLGVDRPEQFESILKGEPPPSRHKLVAPYDRAVEFGYILGLSQAECSPMATRSMTILYGATSAPSAAFLGRCVSTAAP